MSRRSLPKQYLSLDSENKSSFLQITLQRIKNLKQFDNPIVVCNEEHRFITAEQIREININPKSILLEPCSKNTAPAIASAALNSISTGSDPILLILPSDHLIKNNKKFLESIDQAVMSARKGNIVTFGIKPNNPATGYGYIKSEKTYQEGIPKPYKIEKFIEKPEKDLAKKFIQNKNYSWNSGIYMAKASVIINEIENFVPEIILYCKESLINKTNDLDFERLDKKSFTKCPDISIDKAIMEKSSLGVVFHLDIEWSDIGGWKSYWENSKKDENGNVIIGDALQIGSKNCLISSSNRLTVGLGLEEMVVVETNDAVLIAKKSESENVKPLVNYLKNLKRTESQENKKVYRPWGNYLTMDCGSLWKIKKIEVAPGASLSLQLHKKRAEHWIVVEGSAKVEIDNKEFNLKANQSCFVPLGLKHRLSNPGDQKLVIIEVQSGKYLGEDDIIRFHDIYGRGIT
jgi:mannose-1-phosphate guanylyltransferase